MQQLQLKYLSVHVFRVDSVSSSQDGVKSRELGSAALYDVLPSSCPDQPAVPSDAYAAADPHQEEGERGRGCFWTCLDHTFYYSVSAGQKEELGLSRSSCLCFLCNKCVWSNMVCVPQMDMKLVKVSAILHLVGSRWGKSWGPMTWQRIWHLFSMETVL